MNFAFSWIFWLVMNAQISRCAVNCINNGESFHTCTVKLHFLILQSHQVTVNFSVQITVIRSLKICYSQNISHTLHPE